MAFTVPERLSEQNDTGTGGERKVFAALREHLPEDYLVYYDIRVGDRYPDFTVIGPDLGVVAPRSQGLATQVNRGCSARQRGDQDEGRRARRPQPRSPGARIHR